jgi:hypothetical protein
MHDAQQTQSSDWVCVEVAFAIAQLPGVTDHPQSSAQALASKGMPRVRKASSEQATIFQRNPSPRFQLTFLPAVAAMEPK